jgi:hypothetical protein
MIMINKKMQEELISLLQRKSKHAGYQMLPPCLEGAIGKSIKGLSGRKGHDVSRYEWFKSRCGSLSGPVLDIGANLGYFSFRIIQDFKVKVVAYEPYGPHSRILSLIRDICDIDPDDIVIENRGVGLKDIENLPEVETVILLNVLQHAGEDFDHNLVTSHEKWRDYAVEYLVKLKNKASLMFFQMGYTWKGHEGKLCRDNDIIDFTARLLNESGWEIKHCGLPKKMGEPLDYEDYNISCRGHNAVFLPGFTGLAGVLKKKMIHVLKPGYYGFYRFAQRPLFICEVKD